MIVKRIAIAGAILAASLPLLAQADGDPVQGRRSAETCLGCHGIENYKNVYPTYPVPKLCGQNAQYVVMRCALIQSETGPTTRCTLRRRR